MKQIYFLATLFIATLLTNTSCSSSEDSNTEEPDKPKFLISKIEKKSSNNQDKDLKTYQYNSKKQLIEYTRNTFDAFTKEEKSINYTYEYNDNGTPKSMKSKAISNFDIKAQNWTSTFSYSASIVTIKHIGDKNFEENIHVNASGKPDNFITEISNLLGKTYTYTQYSYDNRGNITTYEVGDSDSKGIYLEKGQHTKTKYEYPEQEYNIYYYMAAPIWFKHYIANETALGTNNCIKTTITNKYLGQETTNTKIFTTTYTYNNAKQPATSSTSSNAENSIPEIYNYEYIEAK